MSSPKRETWLAKYKRELAEKLDDSIKTTFDPTDERFVAPAILSRDGGINMKLLFDYDLSAPDRRYLLRKMERERGAFLDRTTDTAMKIKREEQRKVDEAEDVVEMRALRQRFERVNQRIEEKARQVDEFSQRTTLSNTEEERASQRVRERSVFEAKVIPAKVQTAASGVRDFATTFSIVTRLHSPQRRRAAAAGGGGGVGGDEIHRGDHTVGTEQPSSLVDVTFAVSPNGHILEPFTEASVD